MIRSWLQAYERWLMTLALGDTRELLSLTLYSHALAFFLLTFLAQVDAVRFALLAGAACLLLLSALNEPKRRPALVLPWMAYLIIQMVMSAVILWQDGLWSFTVLFWFSTTTPMLLILGQVAAVIAFVSSLGMLVFAHAYGDLVLGPLPRLSFAQAPAWYVGSYLALQCVFWPPLLQVYLARARLVRRIHQHAEQAGAHHDAAQQHRAREQQYIAWLSQDLRNHVARLRVICQRGQPVENGRVHGMTSAMKQVNELACRVRELHDFAQLEAGALSPRPHVVDLSAWLAQYAASWSIEHTEMALSLRLIEEDLAACELVMDVDRVQQILDKLLQHGLALRSVAGAPAELRVSAQRGEMVRLEVFVPDVEISPRQLERIVSNGSMRDAYTQFFDAQHTLGLAMANALAHLLGGDIYMRSMHGSGVSLTLVLPWVEAATSDETIDDVGGGLEAWQHAGDQVRLLLVDDNPVSRMALSEQVHKLSSRVAIWSADGADSALRVMEAGEVDVVLMDLFMPGIGGLACAQTMRERWPATCPPIIGLSAGASRELQREAQASGMVTVIDKASDLITLERTLLSALRAAQI